MEWPCREEMAAFLLRHLLDRTEYVPMLTGRTSPLSDITRVDVELAEATTG